MGMARLPEELIVEILLWLLVKALLRFRCLSKSLRAIIDSPHFINSHLSKSSQNFKLRKLIFKKQWSEFHVCDINLEEDSLSLSLSLSLGNSTSSINLGKSTSLLRGDEFYGYCNGLLLLSRSEFGLTLCNPSTRQHRDLLEIPFELPPHKKFYELVRTGLGYDDSVDDYKAIIMARIKKEHDIQVWIYGFKSNIWRRAQNFPYLEYRVYSGVFEVGQFTTDVSLHWLFPRSSNTWISDIVAFDMKTEKFSLVPQPVCSINTEEEVMTILDVLEGCLCISYYLFRYSYKGREVDQADFYIKKKDQVDQFSWTQLFSITKTERVSFNIHKHGSVTVLGYPRRGDKIMFHFGTFIVSYDLKNKSFAKVEIHGDPDWLHNNDAFLIRPRHW